MGGGIFPAERRTRATSSGKTDFQDAMTQNRVEAALFSEAAEIFNLGTGSVKRSAGGFVAAEPYQLLVAETPDKAGNSRIRVKVRVKFLDLKRTQDGLAYGPYYTTRIKEIPASELHGKINFTYGDSRNQNFMIDFGRGNIPVYVYHYQPNADGSTTAYFIEWWDLLRIRDTKAHESIEVRCYSINRDVIRVASLDGSGSEAFDKAKGNYFGMRKQSIDPIPRAFAQEDLVMVPGGTDEQDIRLYLRRGTAKQNKDGRWSSDELTLFGELEEKN